MWAMDAAGFSLTQVAQGFIDSPEFAATYGSLSNSDFVTQLYANVLHRAPDAEGLKFHVDLLNAGTVSRAQDLAGFSGSPETQAALIRHHRQRLCLHTALGGVAARPSRQTE